MPKQLIEDGSPPGAVVYEPFCGSPPLKKEGIRERTFYDRPAFAAARPGADRNATGNKPGFQ